MRECSRLNRIEAYLEEFEPGAIARLLNDWDLWAREDQLPPRGDWTTWLILGGRGAGKTRAGAEWVRGIALGKSNSRDFAPRIALIGETLSDVRSIMVEGVSGLLAVHTDHERPKFEPSKRQVIWQSGAIAQVFSADDPESLRGPQFSHAWCGVIAVRKARAAIPGEPRASAAQEEGNPSAELRPVWVIVVYEVRNKKLIGITEFVFASRDECQENAAEARQKLGLRLNPVCYLRWMKEGAGRYPGAGR